jgi:hypothetical protein
LSRMTWTVFVGTVSHRRPGPNRTLAPASAAHRKLLLPIEPEKLRVVDDVAFPLEQNMPVFAAQIADRNAASAAALHALSSSWARAPPRGQFYRLSERRTKPNGLYLQRVQREPGFESTIHKNKRSNPPFTKTFKNKARNFRTYEAERPQGLKKPKYSTPRFSPNKSTPRFSRHHDTKTFTEEEVLTRRQLTKF